MKTAVIVPVYNAEGFLRRCLDSLAGQTARDFTAVLVDDGSTDGSRAVIGGYLAKLPPSAVRTFPNAGVSSARNRGLDLALEDPEVDGVTFLDCDDSYTAGCIAAVNGFAAAAPDAIHSWNLVDADGREIAADTTVCCRWYPRKAVEDVRFFTGSDVAEDIAFNLEIAHRHGVRDLHHDAALYRYAAVATSTMHRELGLRDFEMRNALVEYLVAVFSDDAAALDDFCRGELPRLLKQFRRHLGRVRPADRATAEDLFRGELRSLRGRGLLRRGRGLGGLRHYLRFLMMSRGGAR